jgi:hypothetical protein
MIPQINKETIKKLGVKWRGQIGKTYIFYLRRNKQCIRKYAVPVQPNTKAQRKAKKRFALAVKLWHTIPKIRQQYYNEYVKRNHLKMTGFNYFISLFMRGIL